jgi:two-component system, chemotaxis family, sensor kinase CheA
MTGIDLSAAFAGFLVEGRELAEELERGLLQLEQGHDRGDAELVNALFRAAHTVKGSAGIVGIESLGRFTHHVETLLDRVRAGEPLLDDTMISRLLRCVDHIRRLLDLAEAGDLQGSALADEEAVLLAGLRVPDSGTLPAAAAPAAAAAAPAGAGFRLFALFGHDTLRDGIDPASALLYLAERVQVTRRSLLKARIPALAALNPEDCWLALALEAADGGADTAREAFEFFGDGTVLAVCPAGTAPAAVHAALQPLRDAAGDTQLQPWRDAGLVSAAEWDGPAAAAAPVTAPVATPAAAAATAPAPAAAPAPRFLRVPADRLDELILQVGELVIAGATVDVMSRETRNVRLQEAVGQLTNLIDTIQSGTLQLRMVPIGETFNRFQRVVRDVALDLGKQIQLELVGSDTELDKAMVERIGDPLMHLVRNAMDHGLETPADRAAAGKPEQGTLRLRAFHDSGNVVIEVSDDGRGLNRARILAKAVERGIVEDGAALSDHEVYQLIFEPGFSTAEAVTSLSGRGVGMDVVKKSVEALRGTITLSSRPGQGTLVQLRLPLTLAIIDGFMVGVSDTRFILPLDLVVECIELPPDALADGSPHYLNLRGEVLPYVSLREAFGIDGDAVKRPSVVVVRSGELKTGLLVDALHGEIQTVIKPMSRIFRHLRAISGTSILGSGDIALIVDVHQLVQGSVERAARGPSAATIPV